MAKKGRKWTAAAAACTSSDRCGRGMLYICMYVCMAEAQPFLLLLLLYKREQMGKVS
jgi:hypothetical protein